MTPSEALFLCTAALIFFVTSAGGAAALITGIDKLPRVISIAAQPLGGRGLARILGIGWTLFIGAVTQTLVLAGLVANPGPSGIVAAMYLVELSLAGVWVVFLIRRYRTR